MQDIPYQLQVLCLVICLFLFTDKILTNMVYFTVRFSNMKPIFTHFVIHTLILYTSNFYCYCVTLKLCLKNVVIFSLCVLSLSGLLECYSAFGGEKEFMGFFSLFSGKTEYKNYVYLSFRMFFINRDSP